MTTGSSQLGNDQHVLTAHISRALVHAGLVLLNIFSGDLGSHNSVFFEEVVQTQGIVTLPAEGLP